MSRIRRALGPFIPAVKQQPPGPVMFPGVVVGDVSAPGSVPFPPTIPARPRGRIASSPFLPLLDDYGLGVFGLVTFPGTSAKRQLLSDADRDPGNPRNQRRIAATSMNGSNSYSKNPAMMRIGGQYHAATDSGDDAIYIDQAYARALV